MGGALFLGLSLLLSGLAFAQEPATRVEIPIVGLTGLAFLALGVSSTAIRRLRRLR
jgi:hypothetical protein